MKYVTHLVIGVRLHLVQAYFLDVFPALEDSGFAGNLRFLEIVP